MNPPLAATTPTEPPNTGECLFTLEAATSLGILKELISYHWQQERVTDLGLTSVYGVPRLGVHTLRHAQLIMQINFHVRRLLKDDIFWSTISIDASNEDREPQHEHKRNASSIVLVIGAYSGGFTYSMDGLAQLQHKDVGVGTCFTAPYATSKFQGAKFSVELHNRHMKRRASGEDLYLLSCLGFARRSATEPR